MPIVFVGLAMGIFGIILILIAMSIQFRDALRTRRNRGKDITIQWFNVDPLFSIGMGSLLFALFLFWFIYIRTGG